MIAKVLMSWLPLGPWIFNKIIQLFIFWIVNIWTLRTEYLEKCLTWYHSFGIQFISNVSLTWFFISQMPSICTWLTHAYLWFDMFYSIANLWMKYLDNSLTLAYTSGIWRVQIVDDVIGFEKYLLLAKRGQSL